MYDLNYDRTELVNIATKHPDIVAKLDIKWDIWAEQNFLTPLPKDMD